MAKQTRTPEMKEAEKIRGAGAQDSADARTAAGNDIEKDPDSFARPTEEDDLDEGELARKDNSND